MRSRIHLIVCLIMSSFFCAGQSFAGIVPQFVVGGGYDFVIIVTNKADSVKTIDFELLESYHRPWSVPFSVDGEPHRGNVVRVTLPARSVQKLRLTGGQQAHAGYLRYTEDLDPWVFWNPLTTQFFYEYRQGGELIDSIGADTGFATFGSNALAFPVERSAVINTGLALAPWSPPGSSRISFSYTLRLFDRNGNEIARRNFPFTGHEARFLDQFFPDVPGEFLGWVLLEVSPAMFEHVCITVLRLERSSNGFQLTNVRPDFGARMQLF